METDPTLSPSEGSLSPAAPVSDDSRAWLGNVRAGVKARLFADTDIAADGVPPPADERPHRIGRYVVIKRIGAGGMGVVYAAYDDKLDRRVAVKLLRPGFGPGSETARQRLLREAQAIAKLSHRAIIGVYEVGTHRDEVFIAMEYVEGSTLKQWQPSRDWRDVLARYLEAGRGLCAAHAAGIVHRDFKADNVLVRASDLSVRVVDFGLARTGPNASIEGPSADGNDAEGEPSLTHTGLVMGTPAYMAPEQHLALPTDPRTDQFAFCASLFEALYGFRAFAGERLDELRANVLAGRVEPAPRYTAVPPNLHAALARGLSVDPEARHPTMEALLALLELPRPGRPWRRISLALGLTAIVVAGVVASTSGGLGSQSEHAVRLRASFESARRHDAAAELARLNRRSMSERWNDLVLEYAGSAEHSTHRLAALGHLSLEDDRVLERARVLADEALRGGPAFAIHPTSAAIATLAFAPDGPSLLARTEDGTVLRWPRPAETTPERVADGAIAAAAGPGGRVFVALPQGKLSTIEPGGAQRVRRIHDAELTCVAADEKGRVALGATDGAVLLVDGEDVERLEEHHASLAALAFHPEGDTLVSGDRGGRLSLWFLGRHTHRTMSIDDDIRDLAWMRRGEVVVALTSSGAVAWDGERGTRAALPVASDARGFAASRRTDVVLESAQEGLFATLSDGTTMALDAVAEPSTLAVSASGRWGAAGGDGGVMLWRTGLDGDGLGPRGERPIHVDAEDPLIDVHAVGDRIVLVTSGGDVLERTSAGFERTAALGVEVRSARASHQGDHLAVESTSGSLHVVALARASEPIALAQVPDPQPGPMVWSRDGTVVAKMHCASIEACDAALYPVDGGPAAWTRGLRRPISIAPDSSGDRLALLNEDQLTLWSPPDGRRRTAPPAGMSAIAVDFSSDGRVRLASVSTDERGVSLRVTEHDTDGEVRPLFEQVALRRVLATEDRDAVILETSDDRLLLWHLREDRMSTLRDAAIPELEPGFIHVWEQGGRLCIQRDDAGTMTVFGPGRRHQQTIPRLVGPHAALESGGWVELFEPRTLRVWGRAAPASAPAFARWLRTRTTIELPISALRGVAPSSAEAL